MNNPLIDQVDDLLNDVYSLHTKLYALRQELMNPQEQVINGIKFPGDIVLSKECMLEVMKCINDCQNILAIKQVREKSGHGLRESKDFVDALREGKHDPILKAHGIPVAEVFEAEVPGFPGNFGSTVRLSKRAVQRVLDSISNGEPMSATANLVCHYGYQDPMDAKEFVKRLKEGAYSYQLSNLGLKLPETKKTSLHAEVRYKNKNYTLSKPWVDDLLFNLMSEDDYRSSITLLKLPNYAAARDFWFWARLKKDQIMAWDGGPPIEL